MESEGLRLMNKNENGIKYLLFADFGGMCDISNEKDLMALMGFKRRTGSARLSVMNGYMHVENNFDGAAETFFDIPVLSDISDKDYTLQYDITPIMPQSESFTASAAFVGNCSEDLNAYIELPVRMKGRTNHEICIGNCRMSLAKPGMYSPSMHGRAPGQTALVEKLLPDGIYDNTQANLPYLKDKKVVVRIYHEANGRESVYMLVPEEYGGRGQWTIVSRTVSDSAGYAYRYLGYLGNSVKFRVSVGANCLLSEIKLWCGHDDIADKYPALVKEIFCEQSDGEWLLDRLPKYDGGKLSEKLYEDGVGYFRLKAGDSKMQLVSETSLNEFEHYADKLRECGFELSMAANDACLCAYRIKDESFSGYMYYSEKRREARIIVESACNCLPDDFGYSYAKRAGDNTRLYIYGLHMDPNGLNRCDNNDTASNCGMFLILKLADDSLMIIDGGGHPQMNEIAGQELDRFLHEISKTPDGEKVCIRNWFITHDHGDHFNGFARFLFNYRERYEIERVMFHFCAIHLPPNITKLFGELMPLWYPNVMYYKPHTGETVQMGDVLIDVLYTPEDGVNAIDASYLSNDGNDNSTCLSLRFDGGRSLVIGDAYFSAAGIMMLNCTDEKIKSDVVQISHHGLNDLGVLYSRVNADIALYPQSAGGALKANNGHASTVYNNVVKHLSRGKDGICFAGEGTYGIEFVDGVAQVVDIRPVVGRQYGGWETFDLFDTDNRRDNIVHN